MIKSAIAFLSNISVWIRPFLLVLSLVVIILILGLLSFLLLSRIYRSQRNGLAAVRWLKIENQGNTVGVFLLRLDPGLGKVKVNLLHEGKELKNASLPEVQVNPQTENEIQPQDSPSHDSNVSPKHKTNSAAVNPGTGKALKQKATGMIGIGRTIAGVLGAIGSLLPGEIGEGLKAQAAQIQATTQTASRAVTEPEQKKRELEFVRDGIKNLSGQKNSVKSAMAAGQARTEAAEPVESVDSAPVDSPKIAKTARNGNSEKATLFQKDLFQTPAVQPGESILINLICTPLNIYRGTSFSLHIQCRQLQSNGHQADQSFGLTNALRAFDLKGLAAPQAALNILFSIFVVATNFAIVILLLRWLSAHI